MKLDNDNLSFIRRVTSKVPVALFNLFQTLIIVWFFLLQKGTLTLKTTIPVLILIIGAIELLVFIRENKIFIWFFLLKYVVAALFVLTNLGVNPLIALLLLFLAGIFVLHKSLWVNATFLRRIYYENEPLKTIGFEKDIQSKALVGALILLILIDVGLLVDICQQFLKGTLL